MASGMKGTLGVRGRLLLGFGLLALTTALGGGGGWYFLADVGARFDAVHRHELPMVTASLRLAQHSEELAAAARQLASATDPSALTGSRKAVNTSKAAVQASLDALRGLDADAGRWARLKAMVDQADTQLARLDGLVSQRLALTTSQDERRRVLFTAHDAAFKTLNALSEERRDRLQAQSMEIPNDAGALTAVVLLLVGTEVPVQQQFSDAVEAIDRAVTLSVRARSADNADAVEALKSDFAALVERARFNEDVLENLTSNPAPRQAVESVLTLGEDGNGLFDLRARELTIEQESMSATRALAALVDDLGGQVGALAAAAQSDADTAAVEVAQTIKTGIMALLALVGCSLALAVLFAWFQVHRAIVVPITALNAVMGRLAAGDLGATINGCRRRDEIGDMARSVEVFKNNALEKCRLDDAERHRLAAEREASGAQARREAAVAQEISELIEAVSIGDLSRRMDLTGKEGLHRTMSQGMNRLVETIDAVICDLTRVLGAQAQGDLSGRIDKTYRGSFQTVAQDINATTAKLAEMVGNVASATRTISEAAAQVAAGSIDLSERTEQQAAALEETAASLEQLGATARTNAETSRQANKRVGDARLAAEHGNVVANGAIDAMKHISEASRRITEIIGVIDEIAFQTNLLALNAAVEAARAGDAGKGFAVVAQEVRVLAQRSAQASKEIKALILNSDSQVHNGVDQVKKAGESLTGIVAAVQHVAGLIGELAGASQEQAAAVEQINTTVSQLDEMTQKNAALVEETTAAAQAMAEETGTLRQLMAFFEGAPNVSVPPPPRRNR